MSLIGKIVLPGARILKWLAYNSSSQQLRGHTYIERLAYGMLPDQGMIRPDEVKIGQMDAAWFRPAGARNKRIMLFLHGGGYGACSWKTHRILVSVLARKSGFAALAINYRLAPEFPFPAALDDSIAAYRYLVETYPESEIVIGGDSAGGGLAIATLLKLKASGDKLPVKVFALSPWLDLSGSGASMMNRASIDPLFNKAFLDVWAKRYLNGEDPRNPFASPLFGELDNLPELLIHVGECEVLYDDSFRLAEQVKQLGGKIEFKEWPGMLHVFQFLYPILTEARQSMEEITAFIKKTDE